MSAPLPARTFEEWYGLDLPEGDAYWTVERVRSRCEDAFAAGTASRQPEIDRLLGGVKKYAQLLYQALEGSMAAEDWLEQPVEIAGAWSDLGGALLSLEGVVVLDNPHLGERSDG